MRHRRELGESDNKQTKWCNTCQVLSSLWIGHVPGYKVIHVKIHVYDGTLLLIALDVEWHNCTVYNSRGVEDDELSIVLVRDASGRDYTIFCSIATSASLSVSQKVENRPKKL